MESQFLFGDRIPLGELLAEEARQARDTVVLAAPSVHCRYCHRAYSLAEVQICASCGANVCQSCGGTVSNPTGTGDVCIACLQAVVLYRERWHRHEQWQGDSLA